MAPATSSAAELQLADRARDGDHDALVELYRRYRQPLYRHARRMLRDDDAAQDVVQESFARAIAAMPQTREGDLRFKAWIYRIATNLCLKQLNRGARWSGDESHLERATAASTDADPERGRRRAEIADQVAEALGQLPPRYRQILLLRELEELSYEELAEVLELDRNRVKVTLHRARARFAALFIAARLQSDPSAEVECDELAALIGREDRRALVQHLESCGRCRKREQRPAAELFALLPPLPALDHLEPPAHLPGSAAAAAPASGGSMATLVVLAALVPVGVATILFLAPGATHREQRMAGPSPGPSQSTPGPIAGSADRVASVTTLPPASAPRNRDATTTATQRRPAATHRRARGPRLRLKARFIPGTASLRRGAELLALRRGADLRIGDTLVTASGHTMGLLLPGDRWLAHQGALRLEAIPLRGAPCGDRCPVRVALLAGELRVRGTSRGGGVEVRAGGSALLVESGEVQIALDGAQLRIEALDGYARVAGAHAGRVVSPRTHLTLSRGRPGFTQSLVPAPSTLRPVAFRGARPPLLRWSAVPTAAGYRVRIARDAQFMQQERDLLVRVPRLRPAALPAGKHFWQVAAVSRSGVRGLPSKIFSFDIQ